MGILSVVIITLNEERNIERCLRSVLPVADEIIVVDSGSTDRTREICDRYAVSFHTHPWQGYVEQKNFANSLARFSYIFSVDADEALSPELEKSILAAKETMTATAYSMNRLTNYCGKWIRHSGWYPDTKERIFRKDECRWTGKLVHEKLFVPPTGSIRHLDGDLLHYSYYTLEEHITQSNKFSTLSAQELFLQGNRSDLLKLIFSPMVRFLRDYILKGGILDGFSGFQICKVSAFSTFLKHAKLRQLTKTKYS